MPNPAFVHRDLNFGPHNKVLFKGKDVVELQKAINVINIWRKWPLIVVDGECGRATISNGRKAAVSIGILLKAPGLSVYAQHLLRHPGSRSKAQKARAQKWKDAQPKVPEVHGNKVTGGGSQRDQICAAAEAAYHNWARLHNRFYSQPGFWTVEHGITGEPHGARSDCSQFVTALFWSAGAPDPNGNNYHGGFTGTLASHGRYIRRSELRHADLCLYGPPPHHHVELFTGPGNRTIGHGSPPVDPGDIFMMADVHFVRPPGID
jgi:hypothetical protein